MKPGLYTIDSIEQGLVKLLWRQNESVEEVVPFEELGYPAKEGDLVEVKATGDRLFFEYQKDKTAAIKEQIRKIKEELLKRDE
ncbi:hypothetical protein AWH48_11280 [Domibacillus aminovorans]|uniref:Uncharacterized protein n=1 Tax=Domibacillus aminovorans TaxID=29332 RepID=A0A177KL58_9BACI|nr:DUF3006 family protein [Domibacillus aminovorans]OAH53847.1 hypothetical protein AWH48_11280 [Domibacillus aminovorans]